MIEQFIIHLLIIIAIYALLAVSLNLVVGFTGLLNLGHIALFGIGAYTSALLTLNGFPFLPSLILAGIVTSIFGFLLILITKKLKNDYLAIATLGFSFIFFSITINWTSLTNGPLGLSAIPRPEILGITFLSNSMILILYAILAAASILIIHLITKSGFGILLEALRDDELGLRALGKNTFKLKYKAMMISAFFAGIAGSMYAHYLGFIDPTSFLIHEVIFIFTIVIVGGLASTKGSIVGALIIIIVPELLRFIALPSSILGPLRQIIYAVILLAIILWKPKGIFGRVDLSDT